MSVEFFFFPSDSCHFNIEEKEEKNTKNVKKGEKQVVKSIETCYYFLLPLVFNFILLSSFSPQTSLLLATFSLTPSVATFSCCCYCRSPFSFGAVIYSCFFITIATAVILVDTHLRLTSVKKKKKTLPRDRLRIIIIIIIVQVTQAKHET